MPNCFTKFLARISPAKAEFVKTRQTKDGVLLQTTHNRADPGISNVGHSILTVIFYTAFVAYVVISTVSFINKTPPETNSMMPSGQLPAVEVDVTLVCQTGTCGTLTVVENYTAYPETACYKRLAGNPNATNGILSTVVQSGQPLRALLCYTGEDEWSVVTPGNLAVGMIQTIFSDLRGFGSVNVKSVADSGASLSRDLGLDTTSVRALNIGAEVTKLDDEIETVTVYPLQYQAEGFREGTNRSEILLQLVPLANVRSRRSGRTAWELVADFGSAFTTLQIFFTFLVPLWAVVFAVNNNGNDNRRVKAATGTKGYDEMDDASMSNGSGDIGGDASAAAPMDNKVL